MAGSLVAGRVLDAAWNDPDDPSLVAFKILLDDGRGNRSLMGKEEELLDREHVGSGVSEDDLRPLPYDERDRDPNGEYGFRNFGWGLVQDFLDYDRHGRLREQDRGSGVWILDPKAEGDLAARRNDAPQRGLILLGKLEPGKSVFSSNDWINLHPKMAGAITRKGAIRDHPEISGLGHLSDYPGTYSNIPRSEAQREMTRLARLHPEIRDIARRHPASAQNWMMLMKVLSDEGWGPGEAFDALRPAYRLPSRVATYGKGDAGGRKSLVTDLPEDYVMDKLVDSIYGSSLEALRLLDEERKDTLKREEPLKNEGRVRRGDIARKGTGAHPRLFVVHAPLSAVWTARDFLEGNAGAAVRNANEFMARQVMMGNDEGIPVETLSRIRDAGSPVYRYFALRLKGASGNDAFAEAFGIDPKYILSDGEIKDFVSGVQEGIEPLLKQRMITESIGGF